MSYNYFLSHKYKFSFFAAALCFLFFGPLEAETRPAFEKRSALAAKKCRLQQAEAKKGKGS